MGRKLRTQDRILLVLANIGDLIEEIHDPGGWMKNHYQRLSGWVPYRYKRSNFNAVVRRMLRVGYIEKIVKRGEVYIRLTSGGKKKLVRDFPIFAFRKKKWDGICTLFIFDIRELDKIKRDNFRRWIYSIGAGQVQKSAYLLPYDLAIELSEAIENFGLEDEVEIFLTTLDFVKDKKAFAYRVWKLDKLEEEYFEVLEKIEVLENLKDKQRERVLKKVRGDYLRVLLKDPLLPNELLPEEWAGDKLRKLLTKFS